MLSSLVGHILAAAAVLLVACHAQQSCVGSIGKNNGSACNNEGPQGPPGRDGFPGLQGPRGRQGDKGDPGLPEFKATHHKSTGLPAYQDVNLQNKFKELNYRITRMERALALNGRIIVVGKKVFATTEKTADFDETVTICKEAQGSVATPTNRKENDAIMSFVNEFDTYAYLGITEGHVPGEFHFLNGTPLNFTNWYEGEPKGKGTEKCVEMYRDGTWNDKLCDRYRLTVCEF